MVSTNRCQRPFVTQKKENLNFARQDQTLPRWKSKHPVGQPKSKQKIIQKSARVVEKNMNYQKK